MNMETRYHMTAKANVNNNILKGLGCSCFTLIESSFCEGVVSVFDSGVGVMDVPTSKRINPSAHILSCVYDCLFHATKRSSRQNGRMRCATGNLFAEEELERSKM